MKHLTTKVTSYSNFSLLSANLYPADAVPTLCKAPAIFLKTIYYKTDLAGLDVCPECASLVEMQILAGLAI